MHMTKPASCGRYRWPNPAWACAAALEPCRSGWKFPPVWWRKSWATSPAQPLKSITRVRPLDLLRVHHERIEAWILEQAGIVFDAKAAPGALRVVQAA
jgi:hypothetical protein